MKGTYHLKGEKEKKRISQIQVGSNITSIFFPSENSMETIAYMAFYTPRYLFGFIASR